MRKDEREPVNFGRFVFLADRARTFFADWEVAADDTVALLRAESGRNPGSGLLTALVAALTARSSAFADRWALHEVTAHRFGQKQFHHPVVGDMDSAFERLDLPSHSGLILTTYSAEPATPSQRKLQELSKWAETAQP
jgi:hypothetical protein